MARPAVITEPVELGRQAAKSKATQDKIINAVIALIREGGFELETLERFKADGPRFLAEMYRGVARS